VPPTGEGEMSRADRSGGGLTQAGTPPAARPVGRVVILALLAAFPLSPGPASAQPGLDMRVSAGFGGRCKEATWVPLTVDLSNQGKEVSGTLAVELPDPLGRTTTTYLRPVVLGTKARQRVKLYVGRPPSPQESVTLRYPGGQIRRDARVDTIQFSDSLIVLVDRERGALGFLSGAQRLSPTPSAPVPGPGYGSGGAAAANTIHVADCDPEALPDLPQPYQGLDLLVIGEPADPFPPEVKEAIRRWALGGGTLVVMGGPNWARLRDPFYDELLPVTVAGAAELPSLAALATRYGPARLAGSALVTRAAPRPGASTLLQQGSVPLIVEGAVGSGRVIFLAFDATRPPLRGWQAQEGLWNSLLDRAASATPMLQAALANSPSGYMSPFPRTVDRLAQAVLNVPAMKTPPFWSVVVFLTAYLILLVPVNYYVLKWRKRRELAWLTTPAIVFVFVIAAYSIGYAMKGGRLLVNQLSVVETRAGAEAASIATYAGLFSPSKTSYDLGVSDQFTAISEAPYDPSGTSRDLSVLEGETMSLPNVAMDMWSMRVFRLEGLADLKGGVQADLSLAGGSVTGQVTNHTGLRLTKCEVRAAGQTQKLGDLPDGASAKVDLHVGAGRAAAVAPGYAGPSAAAYGYGSAPPGQSPAEAMETAVNEVFFAGPSVQSGRADTPTLTAWCDEPLAGLTVNGRPRVTSNRVFLIVHLALTAGQRGSVTIPFGMCDSLVIDEKGSQSATAEQVGLEIGDGYLAKEFRPPLGEGTFRVDELRLALGFDGSPRTVLVQLWNWETGAWDIAATGEGQQALALSGKPIVVPRPARYASVPRGVVRVRFVHHSPGQRLILRKMDVSLRGRLG